MYRALHGFLTFCLFFFDSAFFLRSWCFAPAFGRIPVLQENAGTVPKQDQMSCMACPAGTEPDARGESCQVGLGKMRENRRVSTTSPGGGVH